MPIYSYQCDNCGFRFERTQKFVDAPISVCPNCRKKRVRKLITPPGIVFKGSGWYATDHRSPSGAGSASKKGGEGGSSESKASDKSEKSEKTEKSETKKSSGSSDE